MFQPKMRQAITPVALAVVSLLAAVALWVAVTDAENPTEDREFPVALRIEAIGVPEGFAVRSVTPDAIRVTVRATDEDFEELTASNFRATVDMTGIRDSESTQAVSVEVTGIDDVEIVSTTSTFSQVTLETAFSKDVPVRVNRVGSLTPGFFISQIEANPDQVTVTGAASLVGLVESAWVDINLTGLRSNLQQQYNLSARDASGADLRRVRVEPTSAEIRLTVLQQDSPQVLPVAVQLQGAIADGYNIVGVTVDPPTVEVRGSIELLQGVTGLDTEPVDISGATTDLTRTVNLQVPTGLQSSRENVRVTIDVEAAPGERVITVAPRVQNIPENLNAELQTTSLTVRVRGATPLLNGLTPAAIQATVNAEGLGEGNHVLDVELGLPEGIELVSVEPPQAVVALTP